MEEAIFQPTCLPCRVQFHAQIARLHLIINMAEGCLASYPVFCYFQTDLLVCIGLKLDRCFFGYSVSNQVVNNIKMKLQFWAGSLAQQIDTLIQL